VSHRLLAATLVPETRFGRRLAAAALVDALGTALFLTVSAVYLTRMVGLSATQVGLGISAAALVGLLTSVPLGVLGDRIGPGRLYVALQVGRAAGFAAYPLVGHRLVDHSSVGAFPQFLAVAATIEICDAALPALAQAVVGLGVDDDQRVTTLAKVRAVRNLGFGLGAAAATGALAAGTRGAFVTLLLLTATAAVGSALLLRRAGITALRTPAPPTGTLAAAPAQLPRLVGDGGYLAAALLNGVLSVHMTLLFVGLPLWLTGHTRVPTPMIGALVVLNTVLAVTLQARFSAAAQGLAGAVGCLGRAGFALAGCAVLAGLTATTAVVPVAATLAVLAVILLSLGELWQSAGGWELSYLLAPPERRTTYLATFQLGTAVQLTAGPALLVALVLPHTFGWLGLAAVTSAAGLLFRALPASRSRQS